MSRCPDYARGVRSAFAPRMWGGHLLALAAVAVAVGLGVWQLNGWQAKREAEEIDLTRLDPVPLTDTMGPDDPFPADAVGRPVTLAGEWVPDGTVYVEGKEHDGGDGYWVVTPVAVGAASDPALLVVRGWSATPEAPLPTGTASLTAWLQPPDGTGQTDRDPSDDVLPQVRIADAIQHVDQDLYGAYGVLDQAADNTNAGADGLEPADLEQLPKSGNFTALRNFLYAIEWWFFGTFAVFVWWRWVRDEGSRLRSTDEGGRPTSGVDRRGGSTDERGSTGGSVG